MKQSTFLFFLFAELLILTTFCSGQDKLIGKWKTKQITLFDQKSKKPFIIGLSNPDNVKADMFKSFLEKPRGNEEKINTIKIKREINKTVRDYLKSKIVFKDFQKFELFSYGLIVPVATPGWHFGNKLSGNWTLKKDDLTLTIGNDKRNYQFAYKIIEQTNIKLILKEILAEEETLGVEMEFFRL
jgi:hypothetical protein